MTREQKLEEALGRLLACPAIADGNHSEPAWGCKETAEAETFARAALSAPKAEAVEPYGYVYEERTPPRFTFSKTRIAISPEDANEYELSETPVYTSPVPALTDEAVYRAVRAHDREDASHRGEPDPWETDYPEEEMADRMFAMRLALLAAFPSKGEGE